MGPDEGVENGAQERAGAEASGSASLPFAMVITDPNLPDNPIVYVNKAFERITQYTADFAIGRNCRFLQGEETSEASVDAIRRGMAEGGDVTVDIVNHRADGTPFLNRLLIAPLPDESGRIVNLLGIQRVLPRDFSSEGTDDDAKDAQMREVADAARASSKGAEATAVGDAKLLDAVRTNVEQHVAMIVSLVRLREDDDIKALAPRKLGRRIESLQLLYEELDQAGVASIHDEMVPLGAYLSRVAATLVHLEGRRSVRVNVDCDMASVASGTAARIGLLLAELLLNALRHGFEDRREGLVNVEFKMLTSGRARLTVKDDGAGMGEEDDWPFTRDELAEDAAEARTGYRVGAKLVRQLIEALAASIDVRSDDYGTTVEVGMTLDETVTADPARAKA